MTESPRWCQDCKQDKDISEFNRGALRKLKDGTTRRYPARVCKECERLRKAASNARWRANHPEYYEQHKRAYPTRQKPEQKRRHEAHVWNDKKPAKPRNVTQDVQALVSEVQSMIAGDERMQARLDHYLKMVQNADEKPVGRGAILGMYNDLTKGRR